MHEIELFFKAWMYTAAAFFSTVSFIWAVIRIWLSMTKSIGDKANLNQRHKFQAGYFDKQEARYDRQEEKMDKIMVLYNEQKDAFCEFEKKALNAEIARLKNG